MGNAYVKPGAAERRVVPSTGGALDEDSQLAREQAAVDLDDYLHAANLASLRAWYRTARIAALAKASNGLASFAFQYKCHRTTAQALALVGKRISPNEFATLTSWRGANGQHLTPWIIASLARINGQRQRAAVLEELRACSLSLIKVRACVRQRKCRHGTG
jgi:hypothetical protein